MKYMHRLIMALSFGMLAAGAPLFAQATPPAPAPTQSAPADTPPSWFQGSVNLMLLGRDTIDSSKFEEYRVVPKGVSMPVFTLEGNKNGNAFALFGRNISQKDQRYSGWGSTVWLDVSFDYNQIPHSIGNNGRSIMTELAPGVWGMSGTLRQALGDRVSAQVPTATRNFDFFSTLYAPTIASAGPVDLNALRQRGNVEFDLTRNLPFNLIVSYQRDVKTGTRGAGGGSIRSFADNIVEVPEPLNEVTQDVGARLAFNRDWGNVHAAFNRNWYNDRQETLVVDNPLVAFDQVFRAAAGAIPATGGTSRALFINPPDNSANTGSFGGLLKLAKQTRVAADLSIGRWTQNAQLYPYTIFSAAVTNTGAPADSTSSLQFQSLDGKINTTNVSLLFSSRPVEGLGLRARYRLYDFANKTPAIPRVGSFAASPDRVFSTTNLTTEPLGYPTASPYSHKRGRFDLAASYDVKALTLEAAVRHTKLDRTFRDVEETSETGFTFAAVYHTGDWLNVRGSVDDASRSASGSELTATTRLMSDEAERDSTRVGFDVEVTPNAKVSFLVAYSRRNDDYQNPDAVTGVAGTAYGLRNAKYDMFTGEIDLTPGERVAVNIFYTYEKNISATQNFSGGTTLLGLLRFEGSDKTNTYGANATLQIVPDKWTGTLLVRSQKVDGLMDVIGDPAGPFSLARAAYGGIQDITDYSDTTLTTVSAQLDYIVTKAWGVSVGYWYEKYVFADAFSAGTEVYPLTGAFYLKANDGPYKANVAFAKLNYRF
jgi:putative beta-barrel porin MtrB/PioB